MVMPGDLYDLTFIEDFIEAKNDGKYLLFIPYRAHMLKIWSFRGLSFNCVTKSVLCFR